MSTPIFFLKNIELTFGGKPIFKDISLQISKGDKICLIGRNGCGKSSLLKIIAGIYDYDKGDRFLNPASNIGYLSQINIEDSTDTVYEHILANLENKEDNKYKADIILSNLDLNGNEQIVNLSGGKLRRASLAKVLIEEPDILLLDEPTNHLDIYSIEWLESYVKQYKGGLICISHDRQFLNNISEKIFWLDRGVIRTLNKGFAHFEAWSNEYYENEQRELQRLNKKLDKENLWLQQGVTARRKRNQGRLKDLYSIRAKLKEDNSHFNKLSSTVKLGDIDSSNSTKLIVEIKNVSYGFTEAKKLISDFSIRIMRGEKIGLIGPNGVGKTTLIKLLLGTIKPLEGSIRLGKDLSISYFDQKRESLDPNLTLWETLCPNGGDTVFINDKHKHVTSYLSDFLFESNQFKSPVSSLSGGEANRLLLAKILISPGNLLILDEPTNDLDMETLDILEDVLSDYKGTVIVVSHDRDFLDRIVTRSLVFTGGKIIDFIGGYTDYTKQITEEKKSNAKSIKQITEKPKQASSKLSYKFARELEQLPTQISTLEQEIKDLEAKLSDGNLYDKNPEEFNKIAASLESKKIELERCEERWLELEEMNSSSDD